MQKLIPERNMLLEHIRKYGNVQTPSEISLLTNFSMSCVKKHAKKLGIKLKEGVYGSPKKREVEERVQFIREHPEMTVAQFAQHFKINYGTVKFTINEYKLPYTKSPAFRPKKAKVISMQSEEELFFNPDKMLAYYY